LINNAGVISEKFKLTDDLIEQTLQTNYFSPLVLTILMLELMNKEGRIIHVSSKAHTQFKSLNFQELENDLEFKNISDKYEILKMYAYSKLGNTMFNRHLALYLQNSNVKTVALHPGVVRTNIAHDIKNLFLKLFYYLLIFPCSLILFKSSFMGAQTTLHLVYMDFDKIENGGYYSDCNLSKVSPFASQDSTMFGFMKYSRIVLNQKIKEHLQPELLKKYLKHLNEIN